MKSHNSRTDPFTSGIAEFFHSPVRITSGTPAPQIIECIGDHDSVGIGNIKRAILDIVNSDSLRAQIVAHRGKELLVVKNGIAIRCAVPSKRADLLLVTPLPSM